MGNISTKIIAQLSGRNLFGFLKKPIELPQQIKPDKPPKHNVREEAVLFLICFGEAFHRIMKNPITSLLFENAKSKYLKMGNFQYLTACDPIEYS